MKSFLLMLTLLIGVHAVKAQSAKFAPDNHTLMRFFENQEYVKAADYLKTIVASEPENMHYLSLLGYVYYMGHQLALAERCYDTIFSSDSTNTTACNYLGNINLLKGDKVHALYYFCRLVDLKPGVAAYYKQLAALCEQLGRSAVATYYYRLSYLINPNDAGVTVGLANGWISQEKYEQADSILDHALQKDSLQEGVLGARIRSAYQQEKYKTIFPLVDKLKAMNAITIQPFFSGAVAYYLTKDYEACTALCDFMIMHDLKTRSVLYLEALAFEKQKKYDLSLAMLDECLADALSNDAIDYFSTKGEIYEKLHQYHTAMKQYDTAYYIFKAPIDLYKKALVYDGKLGKPTRAIRYYEAYLRHRKDTVPPAEIPVLKYVKARTKALKAWKAESGK